MLIQLSIPVIDLTAVVDRTFRASNVISLQAAERGGIPKRDLRALVRHAEPMRQRNCRREEEDQIDVPAVCRKRMPTDSSCARDQQVVCAALERHPAPISKAPTASDTAIFLADNSRQNSPPPKGTGCPPWASPILEHRQDQQAPLAVAQQAVASDKEDA